MTDKAPERDFHAEIDDAIDNLFAPHAGAGQAQPAAAAAAPEKPVSPTSAPLVMENAEPLPSSGLSAEGPDAFSPFEEALLSLDWEISTDNIEKARSALKEIQCNFEVDKAVALTEVFALMDRLLEAMAIAPQSVSTSAPKTLQEGLQTLRAAAGAADLSLIEKTLLDPTLSELRSAIPNIPKDYSKLGQKVSPGPQEVAAPVQSAAVAQATSEPVAAPVQAAAAEEDFALELPAASADKSATVLIEAVNSHLSVLEKCIAKRIVPIENLFAKTPGYEKLHAIHTDLRERMEKQKQILIKALSSDYRADAAVPSDSGAVPGATAPFPWKTVVLATWGGKTVGFLAEQIAYENKPVGAVRKCGQFLPLKNLKRGFFGRIGSVVQGVLASYDEATLKTLTIPVAKPSGAEGYAPQADNSLLILFSGNSGMAFWLDGATETIDTSSGCLWEVAAAPDSLVAGTLKVKGKTVPVITLRSA